MKNKEKNSHFTDVCSLDISKMQHIATTAVHIQQWMFRESARYKHDGYSAEACLTE